MTARYPAVEPDRADTAALARDAIAVRPISPEAEASLATAVERLPGATALCDAEARASTTRHGRLPADRADVFRVHDLPEAIEALTLTDWWSLPEIKQSPGIRRFKAGFIHRPGAAPTGSPAPRTGIEGSRPAVPALRGSASRARQLSELATPAGPAISVGLSFANRRRTASCCIASSSTNASRSINLTERANSGTMSLRQSTSTSGTMS